MFKKVLPAYQLHKIYIYSSKNFQIYQVQNGQLVFII